MIAILIVLVFIIIIFLVFHKIYFQLNFLVIQYPMIILEFLDKVPLKDFLFLLLFNNIFGIFPCFIKLLEQNFNHHY
jgi:hypothetical protein